MSLRQQSGRQPSFDAEAESWFLARGLPAVLTTRGRWRRLWSRSAPVLAFYATIQACGIPIALIRGREHAASMAEGHELTAAEWVLLAIAVGAFLLAAVIGWLVSRLPQGRVRAAAATVVAAVAVIAGVVDAGPSRLSDTAIALAVVLILTGCGVGSVVVWAVRMMFFHLATVGALTIRALPVVLLTALVFFNTYVWIMATTLPGSRLLLAMIFLLGISGVFVTSATVERVRPMFKSAASQTDCERLADTPFAALPDTSLPDTSPNSPLTKAERLNVIFVMAASQLVQITVVAIVTAAVYLILGMIVLTPKLLNEWTHTSVSVAKVFGTAVPVPDSLIHMCLFLAALTYMYVSARAVGDDDYRSIFVDPLMDDLHTTLVARNRYRAAIAAPDDGENRRRESPGRSDIPVPADATEVDPDIDAAAASD